MNEEAIAAKDRETVVVREDLPESRNCNEEIRRDNEALRDAMAGLSATYHTDSGNNAGGETATEDEGTWAIPLASTAKFNFFEMKTLVFARKEWPRKSGYPRQHLKWK